MGKKVNIQKAKCFSCGYDRVFDGARFGGSDPSKPAYIICPKCRAINNFKKVKRAIEGGQHD